MCQPFLIRNSETGAEYECESLERFTEVYGSDPAWYAITGPVRASAVELAQRLADEVQELGEQVQDFVSNAVDSVVDFVHDAIDEVFDEGNE